MITTTVGALKRAVQIMLFENISNTDIHFTEAAGFEHARRGNSRDPWPWMRSREGLQRSRALGLSSTMNAWLRGYDKASKEFLPETIHNASVRDNLSHPTDFEIRF